MQDTTVARLQSTRVRLSSPPSINCIVLRENLSEDSQNIPRATLKTRGSWLISVPLRLEPVFLVSLIGFLLVKTQQHQSSVHSYM